MKTGALLALWSFFVFGSLTYADTCPDIKGTWSGTQALVANVNGTIAYPPSNVAALSITTQNGCLFDIPYIGGNMIGALRTITANRKYAVTIHGFLSPGQNPFLIEGTITCKSTPPKCKHMDAIYHVAAGDPANYVMEAGTITLSK